MRMSCGMRRGLVPAAVVGLTLVLSAPVAASTSSTSVTGRPSVAVVKQGLTKFWDRDQETSVDKITLRFRSLRLHGTRRAVPTRDFVESTKWVTPVSAVFDQRTVRTSQDILNGGTIRSCFVYRVTFTGIFWQGDFGWTFKNRDVKTKRLSSQYRC